MVKKEVGKIFHLGMVHPLFKFLQSFHRYRVEGLDNIPKKGRTLIVVNHSLATYDAGLLFVAILEKLNRMPRSLGDRLIFKMPKFSEFMRGLGVVEGSHSNAQDLLNNEELVFVAPGGMQEALRPSSERYQLLWHRRKGFAKLAIDAQTPVILAMCPRADDIYDVKDSKITKTIYEEFRVPLPLAKGWGFSWFPKPIQLTHYLSKPIKPPKKIADPEAAARSLNRFHARLCKIGQQMMTDHSK